MTTTSGPMYHFSQRAASPESVPPGWALVGKALRSRLTKGSGSIRRARDTQHWATFPQTGQRTKQNGSHRWIGRYCDRWNFPGEEVELRSTARGEGSVSFRICNRVAFSARSQEDPIMVQDTVEEKATGLPFLGDIAFLHRTEK